MIAKMVRLPEDVNAWLTASAERNQRSMNGHIVWILRREMAAEAAAISEETGASVSQTSAPASRINPEVRN